MGHSSRLAAATLLAAVAFAGPASALAGAEVSQRAGVRVAVGAKITPTRLPRHGAAPVAVSVSGQITPTRASALPKLTGIAIAINRRGHLDAGAIPICRLDQIDPSTSAEALAACGSSLIGQGRFSADVRIAEQSPFPSVGRVLAFNGQMQGKPAIFAQIYGTEPVPTSYVLPFALKSAEGTFGTVLEASLPQVTGQWGYVTGISLHLERGFSAGCPAPAGFPGALFPLLRTSFAFAGGLSLSSVLDRSCEVRG